MPKKFLRKRTRARQCAVQILYKLSIADGDIDEIDDDFWDLAGEKDENVKEFALSLVRQCLEKEPFYEEVIAKFIKKDWSMDRIGDVEKCILKLAVSEMLDGETPDITVIDDFVFLTGEFTDNEKTVSFVNGLLENIRKKMVSNE